MALSRKPLLNLLEQTYNARHPNFESIREQYKEILKRTYEEELRADATLLMAGLDAAQHTYEDWEELGDYEKKSALKAVRRTTALAQRIHGKYDVEAK